MFKVIFISLILITQGVAMNGPYSIDDEIPPKPGEDKPRPPFDP